MHVPIKTLYCIMEVCKIQCVPFHILVTMMTEGVKSVVAVNRSFSTVVVQSHLSSSISQSPEVADQRLGNWP